MGNVTKIGVGQAGEACVHSNACLLRQDLIEGFFVALGDQGPAGLGLQGRQTAGDVWSGWSSYISPASSHGWEAESSPRTGLQADGKITVSKKRSLLHFAKLT